MHQLLTLISVTFVPLTLRPQDMRSEGEDTYGSHGIPLPVRPSPNAPGMSGMYPFTRALYRSTSMYLYVSEPDASAESGVLRVMYAMAARITRSVKRPRKRRAGTKDWMLSGMEPTLSEVDRGDIAGALGRFWQSGAETSSAVALALSMYLAMRHGGVSLRYALERSRDRP